jgi:hypothetical protein
VDPLTNPNNDSARKFETNSGGSDDSVSDERKPSAVAEKIAPNATARDSSVPISPAAPASNNGKPAPAEAKTEGGDQAVPSTSGDASKPKAEDQEAKNKNPNSFQRAVGPEDQDTPYSAATGNAPSSTSDSTPSYSSNAVPNRDSAVNGDAGANPTKDGNDRQKDSPSKVPEPSDRDKTAKNGQRDSQKTVPAEVPQTQSDAPMATPPPDVAARSALDHSNTTQPKDQSKSDPTEESRPAPEAQESPQSKPTKPNWFQRMTGRDKPRPSNKEKSGSPGASPNIPEPPNTSSAQQSVPQNQPPVEEFRPANVSSPKSKGSVRKGASFLEIM